MTQFYTKLWQADDTLCNYQIKTRLNFKFQLVLIYTIQGVIIIINHIIN